jgi:hypothetical protein
LFPVVGVAFVLLLLLAPIGFGSSEFEKTTENFCHGPLFGFVAVVLLIWFGNFRWSSSVSRRYLSALLVAVLLGGLGELAQSFTPSRDAEWIDVGNDLLGAIAGLGIYALYIKTHPWSAKVRAALYLVTFAAVVMLVLPLGETGFTYWQRWRQLPELATWSSSLGHHFVKPDGSTLSVTRLRQCSGASNELALDIRPLFHGRWVGLAIEEPWPDWGDYSQLAVDVVNPNDAPLRLSIRVHDRLHNYQFDDRFNRGFEVAARQRVTLSIPVAEIRAAPKSRQLDLKHVAGIIVFQDAELGAYPFYVCGVRLVR